MRTSPRGLELVKSGSQSSVAVKFVSRNYRDISVSLIEGSVHRQEVTEEWLTDKVALRRLVAATEAEPTVSPASGG